MSGDRRAGGGRPTAGDGLVYWLFVDGGCWSAVALIGAAVTALVLWLVRS